MIPPVGAAAIMAKSSRALRCPAAPVIWRSFWIESPPRS